MNNFEKWSVSRSETFWRDIAPGEHVLQIYEDPDSFIKTLAAFVGTGINAGESVIIIAEPEHVALLEDKLREHTLQLPLLVADDRFIVLNTEETLEKFMVDNLPDETKFRELMAKVVARARGRENRKVRGFGEMVARLWTEDNREATLKLEDIWTNYIAEEGISLFCAYPKRIFEDPASQEVRQICSCHSKIIRESNKPLTEVIYRETKVA